MSSLLIITEQFVQFGSLWDVEKRRCLGWCCRSSTNGSKTTCITFFNLNMCLLLTRWADMKFCICLFYFCSHFQFYKFYLLRYIWGELPNNHSLVEPVLPSHLLQVTANFLNTILAIKKVNTERLAAFSLTTFSGD